MGRPKERLTDIIKVDRHFADELRKVSKESGETMIDITAGISLGKKRRSDDPFGLTGVD
jgi:hypothetical protein